MASEMTVRTVAIPAGQLEIHEIGEGSAPGGQVWCPPPQQLHKTPSEPQYFQ